MSLEEAFRPAFRSDLDLAADERLARQYRFGHWTLRDGRHVPVFVRRGAPTGEALEQHMKDRSQP